MLFYFVNYNVWIRVSWIIGPVFCGDTKSYKHWGSSFLSFPVDLRRVRVQTLLGIFKSLITKPHNRLSLNCISEMRLPLQDKKSLMLWPTFHEMWLANCAPCQQSSPDLAPDKAQQPATSQRDTKNSARTLAECFLHGKKSSPKQSLKAGIFVCWTGSGFRWVGRTPLRKLTECYLFFYRQRTRETKKSIASLSCYAWKEHPFIQPDQF